MSGNTRNGMRQSRPSRNNVAGQVGPCVRFKRLLFQDLMGTSIHHRHDKQCPAHLLGIYGTSSHPFFDLYASHACAKSYGFGTCSVYPIISPFHVPTRCITFVHSNLLRFELSKPSIVYYMCSYHYIGITSVYQLVDDSTVTIDVDVDG